MQRLRPYLLNHFTGALALAGRHDKAYLAQWLRRHYPAPQLVAPAQGAVMFGAQQPVHGRGQCIGAPVSAP